MTRAKAQEAIDSAFADGVRHLFAVLVSALINKEDTDAAVRRFSAGIAVHDEAHAKAASTIEKIFPE